VPDVSLDKISQGQYALKGVLMMHTVMSILSEFNGHLTKSKSDLTLDFSAVEKSDSAAVALIISWLGKAKQNGVNLHLHNLPQQILDIAKASDLLDILPID